VLCLSPNSNVTIATYTSQAMPSQLSSEELQALGRNYYKFKQYDKAVDMFTQAIDIAPSLDLHDHRAACYERLNDYNAAVKAGREMIKLDKQGVKGYLRTASVLEKMDKLDVALGIYKYGMKNVPVVDKNFKVSTLRCGIAYLLNCIHSSCNNCTTKPRASYPPQSPSTHSPSFRSNSQKWFSNISPLDT
jgi:tetratricopeptide (TPR) repeat protein